MNVDTASSGGNGKLHELQIGGLKDPHKFKALVWAMKRQRDNNLGGGKTNSGYKAPPVIMEMVERAQQESGDANCGEGEVITLMKDIRDELRENNELLRMIHDSPAKLPRPVDATDGELV